MTDVTDINSDHSSLISDQTRFISDLLSFRCEAKLVAMEVSDAAPAAKIAEIIERERRAEKISQRALAERLGISQSTFQRSLRGERSFRLEELLKAARFLDVKPEVLFAEAA